MSTVERNSPLIKSPLTLLIADNLDHVSEVIELFGFKQIFSLNQLIETPTGSTIDTVVTNPECFNITGLVKAKMINSMIRGLPQQFPSGLLLTYLLKPNQVEKLIEEKINWSRMRIPGIPSALEFITDITLLAVKDRRVTWRCKDPERYCVQLESFMKKVIPE